MSRYIINRQLTVKTARIEIKGQVQGIGFRPFVFRLANALNIAGTVKNTCAGVLIYAQGERLPAFINRLRQKPPPLAIITGFKITYKHIPPFPNFSIIRSKAEGAGAGVDVLPDLSICADCRAELLNPFDRRFLYPFINCTQCGPRYTIIRHLPYDRDRTTMLEFKMCDGCQKEYLDPLNRRFHAEPVACPLCGPQPFLMDSKGKRVDAEPIMGAARAIIRGKILAIKGLGGFHLACDATNERAVKRLRSRKERSSKPLAIMVEDFATVKLICELPPGARKLLLSPAAPIVLLPKRKKPALKVSPLVAPDNFDLGVMVAYTPLHLLIFKTIRELTGKPAALVMTSANHSDEPIVALDQELLQLNGMFDLALTHNRAIANRCDDSVAGMDNGGAVLVRRARGYAPQPLPLGQMFHVEHPTLALGADSRNLIALAAGSKVFFSPHIGELASLASEMFLFEALNRLQEWTKITPSRIVCDLHPDYNSARLAEKLATQFRAPVYRVQHHYAHLLSVMAEHNIVGPVLGISCDGTGYGPDGAIWGCEFMIIQKDFSWSRVGHLGYLRHNAGAGYIPDPVKVALCYLNQCGIDTKDINRIGLNGNVRPYPLPVITSSLGRLFDAVAAITGVCRKATFEGEPAIALECAALLSPTKPWTKARLLTCPILVSEGQLIIDPKPLIEEVVRRTLTSKNPGAVAFWFHQMLIKLFADVLRLLSEKYGFRVVCLSGGSFQNRLLRTGLKKALNRVGIKVYYNRRVPLNDGGIALGQAVVPLGLSSRLPFS
ncbi:MAG: carbamoyltransferase HypF [bacterium]